jgi:hypothetical protein
VILLKYYFKLFFLFFFQEQIELEARREQVRQNVARMSHLYFNLFNQYVCIIHSEIVGTIDSSRKFVVGITRDSSSQYHKKKIFLVKFSSTQRS